MKLRLLPLIAGIICFLSPVLMAQEVSVSISTDRPSYRMNEVVTVTIDVSASGNVDLPAASLPAVPWLKKIPGQSSSSQGINIVNGNYRISRSETIGFLATQTGTFKLGPATATFRGKTIQSNQVPLQIVAADATIKGDNGGETDAVFLRATASKVNPVVGEPVYLSYRLYFRTRVNNPREIKDLNIPGVLTESINTGVPNQRPQTEVVNGVTYNAVNLREFVVYPQKTGTLTIDPYVISIQAARPRKAGRNSIFDDFLMDPFQEYAQISVTSNSLKLTVRSTGDQPADYTGFVGSIDGNRTVSALSTAVNQPVTVTMAFTGTGNFKNFLPPKLTFPAGTEVYPPKETTSLNSGIRGGTGSYSIEYIIIPRYSGDIRIPATTWSWFDTDAGKIKSGTFPEATIRVTGGVAPGTLVPGESYDFRTLGKDISFIRTSADWIPRDRAIRNPVGWALAGSLILIGLLGVALLIQYRIAAGQVDQKTWAHRNANRFARQHLRKARDLAKTADTKQVLGEIHRVFTQFIARKMKLTEAAWTVDEVTAILVQVNMPDETRTRIVSYLARLNEYRFAPIQLISESNEELLNHAETILADLSAYWA